jgi:RNA-directed DNA polymerase
MKSYLTLCPQIITWYNLLRAWHKPRKGKRGKASAAGFEYNLEDNLLALHTELNGKRHQPGAYHSFYIHVPQRRLGWVAYRRSVSCK